MDKQPRSLTVPVAILLAGLLLAVATYAYHDPISFDFFQSNKATLATFVPPSTADHILGNPSAPIKLIEYCDIAAPYCVQFQQVMDAVIAQYGSTGQVAWIYRHFPLTNIDGSAVENAEAAECAGALGGNQAFFGFIDALATSTKPIPSYSNIVTSLGLTNTAFTACLTGGIYSKTIDAAYAQGITAGATGAPYTIVLVDNRKPIAVAGAVPYTEMNNIIQSALRSLATGTSTPITTDAVVQ